MALFESRKSSDELDLHPSSSSVVADRVATTSSADNSDDDSGSRLFIESGDHKWNIASALRDTLESGPGGG